MAAYSCSDVHNAFLYLENQISSRIWNKVGPIDNWIGRTARGEFPKGMGFTINSMMLERTITTSEDGTEWVTAVPSTTNANAQNADNCNPTPEVLTFGQTLRPFTLARRNIQTEEFCINDLQYDFQIGKVLGNVMDMLTHVSEWVWMNRMQNTYSDSCNHKITVKLAGDTDSTTFDATSPPTARLNWPTLENIYQFLVLEGATGEGAIGYVMSTNQPVFSLFTDAMTSRDLIRQDPDLRMDFRYADPQVLLNTPGAPYSYNGFKVDWIKFPPRWEIVGGAYKRIYPYDPKVAATKGFNQPVSNSYRFATFQDSFIFIPTVHTMLYENPDTSPGDGVKFDFASHMGVFKFLVIKDRICNPRGEKGFFDALFASASEPGQTYLGFVLRHLNCGPIGPKKSCLNYS
jgi:hypothetical protein